MRRHQAKTLALVIILLLTGCAEKPAPVLRVGTHIWPGYEPLFLARETGTLSKEKVRLVEYSTASQTLHSFRNGLIDAATITLDQALLLLQSEEQPVIVLVMDISEGADAIISQPDLKRFADLKGKRIALENNALGAYMLSRALEINRLKATDIHTLYLPVEEHLSAFKNKKCDALVTFEPTRSKLLAAGGNNLFDSLQMPGEIVDVLVVKKDYLERHPENVQYLVDGWHSAINALIREPVESAEIMGRRMQLSPVDVLATYNGLILADKARNNQLLQPASNPVLLANAKKLSKEMFNHRLTNTEIDASPLFIKHISHP